VEAFHSTIMDINLTLEMKTSFGHSTPTTGSSIESSTKKSGLPTDNRQRLSRKREEEKPAHKKLQSKAWATTLSKTDPSWPSGQTSRHAKASSGKWYISLQQLASKTFKHVINQI
jgi:hypothetical protein